MIIEQLNDSDTFEQANGKINRNLTQLNVNVQLLPVELRTTDPAGCMSMVAYLRYVNKLCINNSALVGFTYNSVGIAEILPLHHNDVIDAIYGQLDTYFKFLVNPSSALPTEPVPVDNEGNAAPSKYHELIDGVWIISNENQLLLDNDILAAMPALTRRQFRRALVLGGIALEDVETMINTIEDEQTRQLVLIDWQDSIKFERTDSSLLMMADMLGLTRDRVDELWALALTF